MLYHVTKKDSFKLPAIMNLIYSAHARQAAKSDRYGAIQLDPVFSLKGARIIEFETDDYTGEVIKVLIRRKHDAQNDICVAISLTNVEDGIYTAKTVWLNRTSDNHSTVQQEELAKSVAVDALKLQMSAQPFAMVG